MSLSGVLLVVLVVLLWRPQNRKASGDELLKSVPVDARFILKINDLPRWRAEVTGNNEAWQSLREVRSLHQFDSLASCLDSFLQKFPDIRTIAETSTLMASAHTVGKNGTEYLWYLRPDYKYSARELREMTRKIIPVNWNTSLRKYEGVTLTDLHHAGLDLCLAATEQLLIAGRSSMLVEAAIRQSLSGNSIEQQGKLATLLRSSGKNVVANIYLRLPRMLADNKNLPAPENAELLKHYPEPGDWSALDISAREKAILFSGFSSYTDNRQWLSLLQGQKPANTTIAQAFPASTQAYIAFNISDYRLYTEKLTQFIAKAGRSKELAEKQKNINRLSGDLFARMLAAEMDTEVGIARCKLDQPDEEDNLVVAIKVKSPEATADELKKISELIAKNQGLSSRQAWSETKIDGDTRLRIFTMKAPELFTVHFGSLFPEWKTTYASVVGNYLVACGSAKALALVYHYYLRQNQLANNLAFNEAKAYFSDKNSAMLYLSGGATTSLSQAWLSPEVQEGFLRFANSETQFQSAGVELSVSGDMLFTNAYFAAGTSAGSTAQTVWETLLDTVCLQKPLLALNHTDGSREVVIQDALNNLYLINSIGRIVWKIPLPQAIMGTIYQVDAFRNQKLQLVFATADKLYLVDRNGNFVDRYPVTLRSKAMAGLSVFDYDGNRDYRLAIPCEDKKVYLYDIAGNVLPGWNFDGTGTPLRSQLIHCRVGDKDFIVFTDFFRMYMLDRKGASRVSFKGTTPFSDNPLYFVQQGGKLTTSYVATTDTLGQIHRFYFDGHTEIIRIKPMTPAHWFALADIDGNGTQEHIFADAGVLAVYRADNTLVFGKKIATQLTVSPSLYEFAAHDIKIGITDQQKGQLFLFNNNGSLYEGFPLSGNAPFSIGTLNKSIGRFNLVAGNKNNFLVNYAVK